MKLGIIGFGRLGELLARYLAQDFDLLIFDQRSTELRPRIEALGAEAASLEAVCACPVVMPLVPISAFDPLMQTIGPWLQPGTLVIDCCSVKVRPVASMLQHLPEQVEILATHPMFGPDSAAETLFGAKLVLCPVRIAPARYQNLVAYLEKHGLKVIEATPETHDQQISRSLFLAHFLGRTLIELEAGPLPIDTKGYRRMMKILLTVENDSWQLFEDMYHYNPYAADTRQDFIAAMTSVCHKLDAPP